MKGNEVAGNYVLFMKFTRDVIEDKLICDDDDAIPSQAIQHTEEKKLIDFKIDQLLAMSISSRQFNNVIISQFHKKQTAHSSATHWQLHWRAIDLQQQCYEPTPRLHGTATRCLYLIPQPHYPHLQLQTLSINRWYNYQVIIAQRIDLSIKYTRYHKLWIVSWHDIHFASRNAERSPILNGWIRIALHRCQDSTRAVGVENVLFWRKIAISNLFN